MQEYGSGRSQLGIQSNSAENSRQPGATEYLHFGRLIGESAEESSKRLDEIPGSWTKDTRAELYLEKWNHEEDMSYQMFETLLDGENEKTAAIKKFSFESILSEEEEDIQAAFDSLVVERIPEVIATKVRLTYYTTASLRRDDMSLLSPVKRLASFFLPSAPMSVIRANSGSLISLIFTSLTSVSGILSIVLGISARKNGGDE